MSTVLTIGGSSVTLSEYNAWPSDLRMRFADGYSTLQIQRRGGVLPGLPDPWLGKTVSLSIGGTTYFQGDVTDVSPSFDRIGWISAYLCMDLKHRVDRVPMTDSNTLIDTAGYNLLPTDPASISGRQGRNVGQIVTDVLTMFTNATNLYNKGVGAYTTSPPYTSINLPALPSSTTTDLAALTIIPPSGVYVTGEKLFAAIVTFIRYWAPNYLVWIQPSDGAIRFLDKRTFTNHTLTLGTDPVDPTPLRRSVGDCFQRVIVRGQPIAERKVVSLSTGTLEEDFAWNGYTNAQAKANWDPTQAQKDIQAKDHGSCTCSNTTTIVCTSYDPSITYTSDLWDQSHLQGVVDLYYSAGSGLNWVVSRRITSSTVPSGGVYTITVDLPLPATNYDTYDIYGLSNGSGLVWRKYKVVDATVGAAMARQLTYPAPWIGANGDVAVMTQFPMGSVLYSPTGSPPWQEWAVGITIDASTSHIYFLTPTYIMCGYHVPTDVKALLAVNTGNLTATWPADSGGSPVYDGTSYTVEGMTETLTVTVGEWRDPINLGVYTPSPTGMIAYAKDLFESVSPTIVEGDVVYHGYYATALTPGAALSITGNSYTTGWEGLALPILEVVLRWNSGILTQFTTEMHCSNRRAHFSSAAFLHPDREINGQVIGLNGSFGYASAFLGGRTNGYTMSQLPQLLGIDQETLAQMQGQDMGGAAQAAQSDALAAAQGGVQGDMDIDMPVFGSDLGAGERKPFVGPPRLTEAQKTQIAQRKGRAERESQRQDAAIAARQQRAIEDQDRLIARELEANEPPLEAQERSSPGYEGNPPTEEQERSSPDTLGGG